MRRLLSLLAVLVLATGSLAAQSSVWLGAGPTFPMSDYGDYAKTGWMASAGFGLGLGSSGRMGLQFEGLYGSNSHSDVEGDRTTLYGGLANLAYQLGNTAKLHPYVFGGGGLLVHKFGSDDDAYDGESDSKFTYQFGAGLDIPLKSIGLWIDVRYLSRAEDSPTALVPIMAGIYIPLGKN
jgi:opacity protein-like surface antigen